VLSFGDKCFARSAGFKNCDVDPARTVGIRRITRFFASIIQAKLKATKKITKKNAIRKRAVNIRNVEIK
jgi:hypothetical protein